MEWQWPESDEREDEKVRVAGAVRQYAKTDVTVSGVLVASALDLSAKK